MNIPEFKANDPLWRSPSGRQALELSRAGRTARRERINEIYRSVWRPTAREGEGLPLVPDDHIVHMRDWLELGNPPETLFVFADVHAANGVTVASEYVNALASEAITRAMTGAQTGAQ